MYMSQQPHQNKSLSNVIFQIMTRDVTFSNSTSEMHRLHYNVCIICSTLIKHDRIGYWLPICPMISPNGSVSSLFASHMTTKDRQSFIMASRSLLLLLATISLCIWRQVLAQSISKTPMRICEVATDCLTHGLDQSTCRSGICVDDALFPLTQEEEIAGSLGAFVAIVLAAGSGLGGGGLLVPLYIMLMSRSSHEAVPLSKATIFGGAIASFLVNVRKRHPLVPSRPLIDYETMLLMEPMTLAGTIIGVNLNAVFPEWLITLCIVTLLTKTAMRT